MMNLMIEGGAGWAGIAVDVPAADQGWGEASTFYDPAGWSRDSNPGDTDAPTEEWRPNAEPRRRALPWTLRRMW